MAFYWLRVTTILFTPRSVTVSKFALQAASCSAPGFPEVGVYETHGPLDGGGRDVVMVDELAQSDRYLSAGPGGESSLPVRQRPHGQMAKSHVWPPDRFSPENTRFSTWPRSNWPSEVADPAKD